MRKFFLISSLIFFAYFNYSSRAENEPQLQPTNARTKPAISLPKPNLKNKTTTHHHKKHSTQPLSYKVINDYFQKGKISYAKKLALGYLAKNPDDGDVRLVLGQVYMKEKNYPQATKEFRKILAQYPKYTDARVFLKQIESLKKSKNFPLKPAKPVYDYKAINAIFQQGNVEYAKQLALAYLAKTPNDGDVRLVLGQIYMKEKNYDQALLEFERILAQYPTYTDAWVFLADIALAKDNDLAAMRIIRQGLAIQPNNPFLVNEKAKVYFERYQYGIAGAIARDIIRQNPDNKDAISVAQDTLSSIKEVSPHSLYGLNEVGISSENNSVSDLNSVWDYSTAFYSRFTPIGRLAFDMNYAQRFNTKASQQELEFSPVINKFIYFDLFTAYSNQPILFAKYLAGGEGHFSIPQIIDFSLGEKYWYIQPKTYFNTLTGSLSKYLGNYWIKFQPYYYIPGHGGTSTLYTATLTRFFNTDDESISLTGGYGTSPDLSDLLTSNFIFIKNRFISGNVTFPLPFFDHSIVATIAGSYQHWIYPPSVNNLIRNLAGGTVALRYRF